MRISSIQVGRPQELDGGGDPWVSAFFKTSVSGPVALAADNLAGDQQADLSCHGGRDKAVCCYSADHYPAWRRELADDGCGAGWFGENLTIEGQTEESVCLGDIYSAGTVRVEVSQPRGPCWKLGRRWRRLDMPKLARESGRTGWYVRVLTPGTLAAGDELILVARPYPRWTIDTVNRLTYAGEAARRELQRARQALAECPALSAAWRERLEE
jgi:MOSC domain-containing protein YiiM